MHDEHNGKHDSGGCAPESGRQTHRRTQMDTDTDTEADRGRER